MIASDMQKSASPFSGPRPPNEDWLRRALPEAPIDPTLPIVDPHVHFWELSSGYRYFLEEFARDVAACGHNIRSTIFVECNSMYRRSGPAHLHCVGETEFAVGMAAMADSGKYTSTRAAQGIIGFADLALGDRAADVLDAQLAAGNGRLKGIRQRAKWDADPAVRGAMHADGPGLYLRPTFSKGIDRLVERGLLFEASIFHTQIGDVVELARAHPDCSIVVNHSGSPVGHSSYAEKLNEVHATWLTGMRELARCSNVSIKMGGLLMCLGNFDFTVAPRPPTSEELASLWRPYIEPCIELFGAGRCMVSSNFPVEKVGVPYGTVWNMFKRLTAGCTEHEKRQIFSETARRVYSLGPENEA
ncbi:amidohydrolase [Variovorax sp. WS11]|uniref:amidohydrolase family protein n=1 Tax=Variovorax sp. WS11 TaxID=1105204 RepID=UPI000D0E1D7F|nr:amidohydrolase family protein [Variovorax sp. WS11]NDZ18867.1 amidohydrolase family protein [Variovorax sp. WS11]PSL79078.1 amidohydrolase [Variovorax sp. WS11]